MTPPFSFELDSQKSPNNYDPENNYEPDLNNDESNTVLETEFPEEGPDELLKTPSSFAKYALTKRQKEILTGTMLGDGGLRSRSDKSAWLEINHSVKQKNYFEKLFLEFRSLCGDRDPMTIKRHFNKEEQKEYFYYDLSTLTLACLYILYVTWYKPTDQSWKRKKLCQKISKNY